MPTTTKVGVKVLVHNQNEEPIMGAFVADVPSGMHADLKIDTVSDSTVCTNGLVDSLVVFNDHGWS